VAPDDLVLARLDELLCRIDLLERKLVAVSTNENPAVD